MTVAVVVESLRLHRHQAIDGVHQQVIFRVEVMEQGSIGKTGFRRYGAHGHTLHAMTRNQAHCRLCEFLTLLVRDNELMDLEGAKLELISGFLAQQTGAQQ